MATNIVWHQHDVDKARRAQAKKQKSCVLWLTGLSALIARIPKHLDHQTRLPAP